MKKRILALAVASVMTMGLTTTVFADEATHTDGTSSGASVSKSSENETQFYLYVDKDASDSSLEGDGVTSNFDSDDSIDKDDEDGKYIDSSDVNYSYLDHYVVSYEGTTKSNLSVTVPLYVCMYAYGASGTVVTPNSDSYKITNKSTYSEEISVTAVHAAYSVTKITQNDTASTYESYTNYDKYESVITSGMYGYYSYYDSTATDQKVSVIVALSDCDTNSNGDYYYLDSENEITTAKWTDEYATWIYNESSSKYYTSDNSETATFTNADLAVKIPTITADDSWTLVAYDTTTELLAGQLAMAITPVDFTGLNLCKAVDTSLDISGLGWSIEGDSSLGITVDARIAGGSVNESGCTPVVKVTYTIAADTTATKEAAEEE